MIFREAQENNRNQIFKIIKNVNVSVVRLYLNSFIKKDAPTQYLSKKDEEKERFISNNITLPKQSFRKNQLDDKNLMCYPSNQNLDDDEGPPDSEFD